MQSSKKLMLVLGLLLVASMVLAACQPAPTSEPETIVETVVVTVETEGETIIQEVTVTAAPEEMPDTLVICQGQEPDSLYAYEGSMLARTQILEAIYDGPIDANSYDYAPVIIEKIPSLADGDAVLQEVTASEGDTVVDSAGNVITLDAAADPVQTLRVPGSDEPVEYTGGDVTMEQLVVNFKLLPDLMWSDGTPLTASDSVYSFNLQKDPESGTQTFFTFDRTASYEAADDVTIVWTGLPGYYDSLYMTNIFGPSPEHVWGSYAPTELAAAVAADPATMLVGWGPYQVVEYTQGDNVRLVKNENYFRADEGLPEFDNVVYRFIGENSNAGVAAVLAGECDIIDQTVGLEEASELLLELQATGAINPTFVTGTVFEHVDFGIQHRSYDDGYQEGTDRYDFFSDLRVRQGIAHCMDRQAVVDTVFFGQSSTIDVYIPTVHPVYNDQIQTYDYDPEAGMALLAEAGWTDTDGDGILDNGAGQKLSVTYETTTATQRQQATQILADSLTQCGVEVLLNYYPSSEWFADWPDGKLFGRNFDLGQFAWLTGVSPSCNLYLSSAVTGDVGATFISILDDQEYTVIDGPGGANDMGWVNAEFDEVCNSALNSLPGLPEYDANHKLAQEIFARELPSFPLYLRIKLAATRPDMCNFFMDPTNNSEFWNIEEFAYGPLCD